MRGFIYLTRSQRYRRPVLSDLATSDTLDILIGTTRGSLSRMSSFRLEVRSYEGPRGMTVRREYVSRHTSETC